MTDIKKLLKEAEKKLVTSDAPDVDAYEIFKFVTGLGRTDILMNPCAEISERNLDKFSSLIEKRSTGYPLQYIIGEWDFYGFKFQLCEGVLIPRAETEQIADEACRFLKGKKDKVVFDLCSGSGCIGVSVAAHNPDCKVYLADITLYAIEYSDRNRKALAPDNTKVVPLNIFNGFEKSGLPRPDVILCNPPYVTREEFETLQTEIFYEPEKAIVCEGDGLDFYRCLAEKWLPYLNDGGFFIFESGEGQPEKIVEIINSSTDAVFYTECCDDIYGVCRFVKGEKTDVI